MTAITPGLAAAGPVLIAPRAGQIIGLVFAATVLLCLIALMTPRASCCAWSAEPSPA
jgi:hypothetical protein